MYCFFCVDGPWVLSYVFLRDTLPGQHSTWWMMRGSKTGDWGSCRLCCFCLTASPLFACFSLRYRTGQSINFLLSQIDWKEHTPQSKHVIACYFYKPTDAEICAGFTLLAMATNNEQVLKCQMRDFITRNPEYVSFLAQRQGLDVSSVSYSPEGDDLSVAFWERAVGGRLSEMFR